MNLTVSSGNPNAEIQLKNQRSLQGVDYVDLSVRFKQAEIPEKITVNWFLPVTDIYSVWSPSLRRGRQLNADWRKQTTSARLASWMPLHSLLSADGTNRLTVALSDALNPTAIATGVHEEDATMACKIELFTLPVSPMEYYEVTLRFDAHPLPFYDAIYETINWWETECGYTPAAVPEHARLPMNSLWYSYHQQLDPDDIIKECILSKALGMETVIIDDGWQTDDNRRGYAYCGDWEVAAAKIPDMADFIDRIHQTGMKAMLWYSVPFLGIHAKNFKRFQDMLLDESGKKDCWALDPRYPEVREYLINVYASAVRDWKLDGLKLDFIDSFKLAGKSLLPDPRRDLSSLEDAVDRLMTDVTDTLRALKPDILIEFRQSYVGPAIRKYGNMLRVADCPNDALLNRQDVINLRLTSAHTAVHSDMLMWSAAETAENAAMQLAVILYSVPQISVKIDSLPEDHKRMLAFYLDFWKEHRDVLLDGKLTARHPESNYSSACARKDGCAIHTAFTDSLIPCGTERETVAVNATGEDGLICRGAKGASFEIINCMGDTVAKGTVKNDLSELPVPRGGMLFVRR